MSQTVLSKTPNMAAQQRDSPSTEATPFNCFFSPLFFSLQITTQTKKKKVFYRLKCWSFSQSFCVPSVSSLQLALSVWQLVRHLYLHYAATELHLPSPATKDRWANSRGFPLIDGRGESQCLAGNDARPCLDGALWQEWIRPTCGCWYMDFN